MNAGSRAVLATVFVATILSGVRHGVAGSSSDTNAWRVLKSDHFMVWYVGSGDFAERMKNRAETLFTRIMRDLGYAQRDGFWLWDNRCTIRVHPTAESFRTSVGAPEWAGGCADPSERAIETFEGSATFAERVLPHELTHLVFREFVGFKGDVPLWLNEGVAVWESARITGRPAPPCEGGGAMSLADMVEPDLRKVGAGAASNLYAQSAAVVGFLFDTGGAEKFGVFCRQLRDGKTLNDALRFTYGPAMGNMEALERAFRAGKEEKEDK